MNDFDSITAAAGRASKAILFTLPLEMRLIASSFVGLFALVSGPLRGPFARGPAPPVEARPSAESSSRPR